MGWAMLGHCSGGGSAEVDTTTFSSLLQAQLYLSNKGHF
jgi:hypothetical protein